MSRENTLWGAPRIHGELLKLGFSISQGRRLEIHGPLPLAALAGVADIPYKSRLLPDSDRLFRGSPRPRSASCSGSSWSTTSAARIVHFSVTANPTMAWVAQQIREVFPWETTPRFLLRDRDAVYGVEFRDRVLSMGIEEVITAPRSPWQNPYVERVIGTLRGECLGPRNHPQ